MTLTIPPALRCFFEEDLNFRVAPAGPDTGPSIWIGSTEFSAARVLSYDEDAYTEEFNRWQERDWLPNMERKRRDVMESTADRQRYRELRDQVIGAAVIPFVGSGMSVPSGLPTWSELLRKARTRTGVSARALESKLVRGNFEEAADLLVNGGNLRLFNECVQRELSLEAGTGPKGAVRLVPHLFPKLAITTNLDSVLEQCYIADGYGDVEILAGTDVGRYRSLKREDKRFVLKLHGDRSREDTRVMLKAEYERAYAPKGVARSELELLVRNYRLLFLGCSLGPDRTVRLVHEVSKRDRAMPRHFAFLPLPESTRTRNQREEFLSDRAIFPIWYSGEHDEAITALFAGLIQPQTYGVDS